MIKVDPFTYSTQDWDEIKRAAEKGLFPTAAHHLQILTWIDGPWPPGLLRRLEFMARMHIARMGRVSAAQQRSRIRKLKALEYSAPGIEEKIVASLSTNLSVLGDGRRELQLGVERDFLDVTQSFFGRLRYNIERALWAQRPLTGSNASKRNRDRFWYEALGIWCELGGEPTGGDAADFLIAVSRPVFREMRTYGARKNAATIPLHRATVLDWLRRQAKAWAHENGDDFSSAS